MSKPIEKEVLKRIPVKESSTQYKTLSDKKKKRYKFFFGFGPMTDQMSHQFFQFLIFTYYYAVVGVSTTALTWSFLIFAIWDSINVPLIGPISDRTKSKHGRRKFWIAVSLIPFALANIIIFTAPMNANDLVKVLYMLGTICLYDAVYTIFSVNVLATFSEMFETDEERGAANSSRNVLIIVGLIIGFVLPTIFINPLVPTSETSPEIVAQIPKMYSIAGFAIAGFIIVFGLIFIKYGIKERQISEEDRAKMPGFKEMLLDTIKNKAFILFCIANLIKWFVFKMLTTIISLYAIHVLGVGQGDFMISFLLLSAFLSAAVCFPFLKKLGKKVGWRNGFIITQVIWSLVLIPFWFLDNRPYLALIGMIFMGIGLAGAMYFVDPMIADLIDEDELKSGHNRAGSYYGINGLINRYSTILVFAVIALVLNNYGWKEYLVGPNSDFSALAQGLKVLFVPVSIFANILVILLLWKFPLVGERLQRVREKIAEKRERER